MRPKSDPLLLCFLALVSAWAQATQAPRVDSLAPASGGIAGGDSITVRGANLTGAKVQVNQTAVVPASQSDSEIRFVTPPQENGIAIVTVSGPGGAAHVEYLYLPPSLDSIPPGAITTVAGVGFFLGDWRPATAAMVAVTNIAVDSGGSVYIEEPSENRVRRIGPDGIIEPFIGSGTAGPSGDGGPALDAGVGFPRGLAMDPRGNFYVADASQRIRRIDAGSGIITTIAGTGTAGFSGDGGPALMAQFRDPTHLAFDRDGNLFVLDNDNFRIRRIAPDGAISTYAGAGTEGFSGDGGPAANAQFDTCWDGDEGGLTMDADGNLLLADTCNNRVRRIDGRTGIINTIAVANHVESAIADPQGNVYFATNDPAASPMIVTIDAAGRIIASWGGGAYGFSPDGTPANHAAMMFIQRIELEGNGNILFAENQLRLRRINLKTGLLETVAGMGPQEIGEGGPAIAAVLSNDHSDLTISPRGELLLAETDGGRLRQIDLQGNIHTVAGAGWPIYPSLDGVPALETGLSALTAAKPDAAGGILLSEFGQSTIKRIDSNGIIRRVAGNFQADFAGDVGSAMQAALDQPWDVLTDIAGNLLIADTNNNRIRKVDAKTGTMTTVAGSGPVNGWERYGQAGGYCGDGGPATQACLNTPYGIAMEKAGNLFIAEGSTVAGGGHIRKVDRNGAIQTFVQGHFATKLTFDDAGNLYAPLVYESSSIVRISPDGSVNWIAGGGPVGVGFSGDGGPALKAQLGLSVQSAGLAIDAQGNVFFCDGPNRRVRAIKLGALVAPPNATIAAGSGAPQSVPLNTALHTPLEALVLDAYGHPAVGVRVDFSAPSRGPSCAFPGGSATFSARTDPTGKVQASCTANNQAGGYIVTATPLASPAIASFGLSNIADGSSPIPQVNSGGVVNAASLAPGPVAPGSIASVFGVQLAGDSGQANVLPLPSGMFDSQLYVGGFQAPYFYASPLQLNVQIPFEAVPNAAAGILAVRVGREGPPVVTAIGSWAPGLFAASGAGVGQGVILIANTPLLAAPAGAVAGAPSRPASIGEYVTIYATGLGAVTNQPPTGSPASADSLSQTLAMPAVRVGGVVAPVAFSGLAPNYVGLYQVNVRVPPGTPSGAAVPVVLTIAGATSNTVTMAVQ